MKKILFWEIKKAFTLAEVLITLTVIGVIAAATIPTLISQYQKKQYVVGLKRAYSQMSQMFKQYMTDEGVSSLEQSALFATPNNYTELDKVITKYFKTAKVCKIGDNSCNITESYLGRPGSQTRFDGNYGYSFCTVDGMCFAISFLTASECTPQNYSDLYNMKGECYFVIVDINGAKPPNTWGRDFFMLFVGPDGNLYAYLSRDYSRLEARYWRNSSSFCGTAGSTDITTNVYGDGCAARIMEEGWEMNY